MNEPPNILLVIMDCVRARNTSVHGYDRETTPFLSEFATNSTFYQQARSAAPKTLTSHVSMFTGLAVAEHGVEFRNTTLRPEATIWRELAENDSYSTGIFSGNLFLTKLDVGITDSFDYSFAGSVPYPDGLNPRDYITNDGPDYIAFLRDIFQDRSFVKSLLNGIAVVSKSKNDGRRAEQFTDEFLSWEAETDGPWAACINYMDAHAPYRPPASANKWANGEAEKLMAEIDHAVWEFQCGHRPYKQLEQIKDLYDGCIRHIDSEIGRVVNALENRNELENTLVVVTADHGEGFGEQSRIRPDTRLAGHGEAKIHECLLHVPLLVKHPGQEMGLQIENPVSLTDFPIAVKQSINDNHEEDSFTTDNSVIATAVGLQNKTTDSADRYCEDFDQYMGRARALYRPTSNCVEKYMTWRSHSTAVEIVDEQTIRTIRANDIEENVTAVFNELDDAGVSESNPREIDSATEEQLRNLGYS